MRSVLLLALLLAASPAAARRAGSVEADFKKIDRLIEKSEYAKARKLLDEVRPELKDDDARLVRYYERTGASWLGEGNADDAKIAFTAALKVIQRLKSTDEHGAKAYVGLGLCLRRENNDKYALRFFKKAFAFQLDDGTRMFVEDQIREIEGDAPLPAR